MLSVVENGLDTCAVGGKNSLDASGEVDTILRVSDSSSEEKRRIYSQPVDIPIQPRGICLLVILPKAYI